MIFLFVNFDSLLASFPFLVGKYIFLYNSFPCEKYFSREIREFCFSSFPFEMFFLLFRAIFPFLWEKYNVSVGFLVPAKVFFFSRECCEFCFFLSRNFFSYEDFFFENFFLLTRIFVSFEEFLFLSRIFFFFEQPRISFLKKILLFCDTCRKKKF